MEEIFLIYFTSLFDIIIDCDYEIRYSNKKFFIFDALTNFLFEFHLFDWRSREIKYFLWCCRCFSAENTLRFCELYRGRISISNWEFFSELSTRCLHDTVLCHWYLLLKKLEKAFFCQKLFSLTDNQKLIMWIVDRVSRF